MTYHLYIQLCGNRVEHFRWNMVDSGVDIAFPYDYTELMRICEEGGMPLITTLLPMGFRAVMTEVIETRGGRSEIPVPYRIVPRSSIYKTGIRMANSEGIIDEGYRGEIHVPVDLQMRFVCKSTGEGLKMMEDPFPLRVGGRFFQIVTRDLTPIGKVTFVNDLPFSTTERGEGGFGSTGNTVA